MNTDQEQIRAVIAQQAADWFVRHRAADLTAADDRAFDAWLAVSPVHIEEYLGIAQLTQELPKAAAAFSATVSLERLLERARNDDSSVLGLDARPFTRPIRARRDIRVVRRNLAACAAVLAVLALGILWWGSDRSTVEHFATQHGEQKAWQLADRSVLRLNTDTVVSVHYSDRTRVAELVQGQAYFEVTHDASRPFQVEAGVAHITAIGTAFDVYRKAQSILITVVEGQVAVGMGSMSMHASAGEQVRATAGVPPLTLATADLMRNTAWLHRRVVLNEQLLGEVVAEFSRYSALPITLESPALAQIHVSGVFSTDDTASFIAFLRSIKDVTVDIDATRIRVRERHPESRSATEKYP